MPLELLGSIIIFIYLLSTILTAGGRNQSLLKLLYKEMPLGRALGCKRNCQKPAVMSMLVNRQLRKCEEIVLWNFSHKELWHHKFYFVYKKVNVPKTPSWRLAGWGDFIQHFFQVLNGNSGPGLPASVGGVWCTGNSWTCDRRGFTVISF